MSVEEFDNLDTGFEPINDPLRAELDKLEEAVESYYGACGAFSRKPIPRLIPAIQESLQPQINLFHSSLQIASQDETPSDLSKIAISIILERDDDRVEFLNKAIGCNKIVSVDKQSLFQDQSSWQEYEEEELKAGICGFYAEVFSVCLSGDTARYIDIVTQESKPLTRKIEQQEMMMNHAIDVGKMVLGTAIGVIIANSMRRR